MKLRRQIVVLEITYDEDPQSDIGFVQPPAAWDWVCLTGERVRVLAAGYIEEVEDPS
jgi:hypothetical protein